MARESRSKITTDHEEIRRWTEERGGQPACLPGTGERDDFGVLRLDFPGDDLEEPLLPITWEEFFDRFEENGLALQYPDDPSDGDPRRSSRLIQRDAEP